MTTLVPITTTIELGEPADDGTPRLASTTKAMQYTVIIAQSLIDPGAVNIEIFPDEELDENPRLSVHLNDYALHDTRTLPKPTIYPKGIVFVNVNEEGEEYGRHRDLNAALAYGAEFPNDTIVVQHD